MGFLNMRLVIVTGMSGAGKTTALKILEDMGYYCVDNLPPQLISKFSELCLSPEADIQKIALGIDIRGGKLFDELLPAIEGLRGSENPPLIIYLDSSDEILLNRFKETRRSHPLAKGARIIDGIIQERELLADIKKHASFIVDTSRTLTRDLRERITEIITGQKENFDNLMITVISFGFKYGIPTDSDLVLDVRFLPNPFYVPDLKALTGNDALVENFVMEKEASRVFLEKAGDLLEFLIPHYVSEGKNRLVISIGCTGGKHRSVTLCNHIYNKLETLGLNVNKLHRDIKN